MISKRERFLMQQAMNAADNYDCDLEWWLNEAIDDLGNTAEDLLSWEADQHESKAEQKS